MIIRSSFCLAALLLVGSSGIVAASTGSEEAGESLMSLEAFQERRAVIEENFADGGAYMEISRTDRRAVVSSLDLMESLMARYDGIERMNQEARIQLFNEQEIVNEILTTAARDSRLRCERRGRVGTRFKTTVCETYAERRQRMEDQRALYDGNRPYLLPEGGGWSGGPFQGGRPNN